MKAADTWLMGESLLPVAATGTRKRRTDLMNHRLPGEAGTGKCVHSDQEES